ncbi:DUF262 domain-containing protein [Elizabethkingia anophelis]|uniref:DUF262 domain-containing protein n=1 Tax=Elizabethkingia anophelis TaxID=1117645 RepID=UPI000840309C|nr:DUF262 domain-containing protein [Elizabethkingia anophelis]MVW81855.1 DUF262 domain-containing protein [Elizabethkingia anophelis]OCW75136.1 hypothetical protein A4G24_08685 [Elizabethkingia anophelis]
MSDQRNRISVKPEIDRLINILDYIKKGKLVVPKFQRDYIWDKKQRIDLFDSIKRGFPIGSLLFWNPDSNEYEYNNQIGPYIFPNNPGKFSYIIDGYQRITTLFSALINPADNGVNLDINTNIQDYTVYYDLENEEFTQPTSNKYIEDCYIPVYKLVDTFSFLSFSDNLKSVYGEETSIIFINRAKQLATTLLDYSIAYVNINGGTIQDSVEIFSRINSKGSDMSPMWMLSALTYNNGFKFSEEIDKLKDRLEIYNFQELKTEIILQCVETATGKIYFDVKTESLAKRKDFNDLCFETFECIIRVVKFLYEELNVVNYKLLPYNLQLIFLTEFFRQNRNLEDATSIKALKKWFWQTSYSNYFTIYSLSKQRKAFLKFQEFCRGEIDDPLFKDNNERFIVPEFPKNIYYGSVRSKTFALFLIKNVCDKRNFKNKDLEDFYSIDGISKNAEFMFPKFVELDYLLRGNNSKGRITDYSFILDDYVENFDYEANFVPVDTKKIDIGKQRYNLIKEKECDFIESLGDLEYEPYFT